MEFSGGGVVSKESTTRDQELLIPKGATWIPKSVFKLFPVENKLLLGDGLLLEYEILIVAAGIQINWDGIKGLKESIGLDNIIAFAPLQVIQRLDRFESYKEKTSIELYPHIQDASVKVIDVRSKKE